MTNQVTFRFHPRWKEELVCSCELGAVVIEMTMGVDHVYLPAESVWQRQAPEWARALWPQLHAQLAEWCRREKIPLDVEDAAWVVSDSPG
jgi:hypothetical protein